MSPQAIAPPRRKSPAAAYHHGDLRKALKDAALEVLSGPEAHALSFRELARKLGVTSAAPYFHFKDKTALLVEIAIDGFNLLHQKMESKMLMKDTSEEGPYQLAMVYLDFAANERGYYQAMFLPEVSGASDISELQQAADRNFALVSKAIASVRPQLNPQEVTERAASIWSFLYGVDILKSSGRLGKRIPPAQQREFFLRAVRRLLAE